MKTHELFNILETNKDKSLLFQYTTGQIVPANYHITEVKHVTIDSVDCGGQMDTWNETIVQLWENPLEMGKSAFMSCAKALDILNKVGSMKSYDAASEVKFEYSNSLFHTAQLFVIDYTIHGTNVMFNLAVEKTDCKAKELCGVPEPEAIASASASCAPGSGCC